MEKEKLNSSIGSDINNYIDERIKIFSDDNLKSTNEALIDEMLVRELIKIKNGLNIILNNHK